MRRTRQIRHEQTRRESEDYLEMVMFRDSWGDLSNLFEAYFGRPLQAPGQDPNDEAQRVSDPYGGITTEQALYHTFRDDADHEAVIWPWSDGKRLNVKIIQEQASPE